MQCNWRVEFDGKEQVGHITLVKERMNSAIWDYCAARRTFPALAHSEKSAQSFTGPTGQRIKVWVRFSAAVNWYNSMRATVELLQK